MKYPKECVLTDCAECSLRPLTPDDEKMLGDFYQEIPEVDRWCMRYNVWEPEVIGKWFQAIEKGTVDSIVAVCGDRIVGHGSLHRRGFGATQHVGRFRIVVLPAFRNKRLGTWLLLDLIQLAMERGMEALRTDLVTGLEDAAIEAVQKFDFFEHARLKSYAKGPDGKAQDMLIMIKHLHRELGNF